jgi:hypothetical protein
LSLALELGATPIVDVLLAVPDADAAWQAFHMARGGNAGPLLERALSGVARLCSDTQLAEAVVLTHSRDASGDENGAERRAFAAFFDGLGKAGKRLTPGTALAEWGRTLATGVLAERGSRDAAATLVALSVAEQVRLDGAADSIRVLFLRKQGTTYAIKAQRNGIVRTGVCRPVGTRVKCNINVLTGRWRVTVTPKVNGKTGKPIIRTITT